MSSTSGSPPTPARRASDRKPKSRSPGSTRSAMARFWARWTPWATIERDTAADTPLDQQRPARRFLAGFKLRF